MACTKSHGAEAEKAIEHGLSQIESGLDIIRLFDTSADFGIKGRQLADPESGEILCVGLDTRHMELSYRPLGIGWPHRLSDGEVRILSTDPSLVKLQTLLTQSLKSDMEERLVNALAWFGKSVRHKDPRDRILSAMIGLEALSLRPYESGKTEAMAERAAFLLGSDAEERVDVYHRLLSLGNIRNSIVHKGDMAVLDTDADRAIVLLERLLLAVAKIADRLERIDDLKQHVDSIKFR